MIKYIKNIKEYLEFIHELRNDKNYSDPMLVTKEEMQVNLLKAPNKKDNIILGVFEKDEIIGLFVFLVLEDEKYIEMIVGLSKNKKAYDEVFDYLIQNYKGYLIDFVYNPNNDLIQNKLKEVNANFEKKQIKMILKEKVFVPTNHEVVLYNSKYKKEYCEIHSSEGYWKAEKMIQALDKFRIILVLENNEVVGYTDVTHKFKENEIYDIYVKEEYRRKGYAKAMLNKVIELEDSNYISLLVDYDNEEAIGLYKSFGFIDKSDENSITAHLKL